MKNIYFGSATQFRESKPTIRNRNPCQKIMKKENECWTCHKVFPRNYSLKRHLLLVHSGKDKENSGGVKNGTDKSEKGSITTILFKKKPSNGNSTFSSPCTLRCTFSNATIFFAAGAGSEWLCTHCNLTFDNPSVLNLHTLTHAAEDLESEAVLGIYSYRFISFISK